jgi:hypothetical protein
MTNWTMPNALIHCVVVHNIYSLSYLIIISLYQKKKVIFLFPKHLSRNLPISPIILPSMFEQSQINLSVFDNAVNSSYFAETS